MTKIVRTKTRAEGGITAAEKIKLDEVAAFWTANALRTDPVDPERLTDAIKRLYAAADLKEPRVVIVPSPIVMAAAYGAAAAIWRGGRSNRAATDAATRAATDSATYAATYAATDAATDSATAEATRAAAFSACMAIAGDFGIACARRWYDNYQGGNMWSGFPAYVAGLRDVIGLDLPIFAKWKAYEDCAREGGFRVLHEEFCIVCDRPAILRIDAQNRPHCEDGPSHMWRDGWALYHWHGVRVPDHWIADRANLKASEVMAERNVEVRRAGIEILGWKTVIDQLGGKVIEADADPEIGSVIEISLPDLPRPARFLRVRCATGRDFALGLPPDLPTAEGFSLPHCAQAWAASLHPAEWRKPSLTA